MSRISGWVKWASLVVLAGVSAAFFIPYPVRGVSPEGPRPAKFVPEPGLTVHEWGTFTTFAGSNGVQLEFRPLLDADLPNFVLDRQRQAGAVPLFNKGSFSAPLRMETPVTYFYTDEPRRVRVRVDFPQGLLTEFYPPVRQMEPPYTRRRPSVLGPSSLDWGEIALIPEHSLRVPLDDDSLSASLAERLMSTSPPAAGNSPHYAYARETDSALVAVNLPPVQINPESGKLPPPGGLHVEKFLFYRGLGKVELPIETELTDDGAARITNLGSEPIRSLFFINVTGQSIARRFLKELPANGALVMDSASESVSLEQLIQEVQARLEAEGLYPKEAAAMTKTWSDSWFQEQGTRLFYMVPRSVTDRALPLKVEPAPDEMVRVLVGRMELLPIKQEAALLQAIQQSATAYAARLKAQGDPSTLPIPDEVTQLGRFAEPALCRIHELAKSNADALEARRLLAVLRSRK